MNFRDRAEFIEVEAELNHLERIFKYEKNDTGIVLNDIVARGHFSTGRGVYLSLTFSVNEIYETEEEAKPLRNNENIKGRKNINNIISQIYYL